MDPPRADCVRLLSPASQLLLYSYGHLVVVNSSDLKTSWGVAYPYQLASCTVSTDREVILVLENEKTSSMCIPSRLSFLSVCELGLTCFATRNHNQSLLHWKFAIHCRGSRRLLEDVYRREKSGRELITSSSPLRLMLYLSENFHCTNRVKSDGNNCAPRFLEQSSDCSS